MTLKPEGQMYLLLTGADGRSVRKKILQYPPQTARPIGVITDVIRGSIWPAAICVGTRIRRIDRIIGPRAVEAGGYIYVCDHAQSVYKVKKRNVDFRFFW